MTRKAKKKNTCVICQKECTTEASLFEHLSSAHKEAFVLPGTKEEDLTEVQRHILHSYSPQITRQCPFPGCFKQDSYPSAISRHVWKYHWDVVQGVIMNAPVNNRAPEPTMQWIKQRVLTKPGHVAFPCDHDGCREVFRTESDKNSHMKHEHGKEKPRFQCPLCTASFARDAALQLHLIKHRRAAQGFVCKECGKQYTTKANLRIHVKAAHENVRYQCPLCSGSCKYTHKFREHMAALHGWDPAPKSWPPSKFADFRVCGTD
ncbi:Zinc-finger double domain [Carpediemonas membranifera]|uniref:Zinc-finger double domain n=1 Tax=Carpediemonas membranifera TaxID=201153 RepID=A0A8J6E3G1_9EUKA|nr:Zinc-finger double domain [Carpediemonas membranifera]|eukprot:KAG9393127.1 Zinc-finger double domain [Carpediemonas membranifera]